MNSLIVSGTTLVGAIIGLLLNGVIGAAFGYVAFSFVSILLVEIFKDKISNYETQSAVDYASLAKYCFYLSGLVMGIGFGWSFGTKVFS